MSISEDLHAHYDSYYEGPSEWRRIGAADKADNIRRLWRESRRPSIVDIGCGEGSLAGALSGFYADYHGFDISGSAIDVAREQGIDSAVFDAFDGVRLPLPDGAVDLAVLSHVVEHLEHPRTLIAEAARVARAVLIEVPLEFTARTPRDFRWTPTGHINLYSPVLIRHLLQSTGLRIVDEMVTNPGRPVFLHGRSRWKGTAQWAVRQAALTVVRPLATRVFVYHWCGLAEPGAVVGADDERGSPVASRA